jgi:hypothetical protein
MPTFRCRQEENKVLKSFDFGDRIYPMIEIVKEYDRKRKNQKSFETIHRELINNIRAKYVFVDMPLSLSINRSTKDEVQAFSLKVTRKVDFRTMYLNKLWAPINKIIPVISSYKLLGERESFLAQQYSTLKAAFGRVAIRLKYSEIIEHINEITSLVNSEDYLIIDYGELVLNPDSSSMEQLTSIISTFNKCTKIILRSAIHHTVQNVELKDNEVIYEADNSIINNFTKYGVNAFGDYAGIKKDLITSGGGVSPGFIYYDPINNRYVGFKWKEKRALYEFETHIVPSVINSEVTREMLKRPEGFLSNSNYGWKILNNIHRGEESGKNQAKFKRISMEHYLHCMKVLIENNLI